MRNKVISYCMNIIKKNENYSTTKLEEIKYGLEGLYLQITKILILILMSIILNMTKEFFIFLGIYTVIRCTSFGLHATKSWICLVSSILIFIGMPLICKYLILSTYFKLILGIILILFIYINAPADTIKRPIVNRKRRLFFKYISTIIAIIFVYMSILINVNFLSNCFIFSLMVQSFMISPLVYKIFRLPYNNYLKYCSI